MFEDGPLAPKPGWDSRACGLGTGLVERPPERLEQQPVLLYLKGV